MSKRRKHISSPPTPTDDLELWSQVTESVTPLKRRLGDSPMPRSKPAAAADNDPLRETAGNQPQKPGAAAAQARPVRRPQPANAPPRLTGLDRRTRQKLARGNAEIEARLDLHGMGKENARTALKSFLISSRTAGRRTVLVITGKGHSPYSSHTLHGYEHINTPERLGVIRKAFPQWLNEPEFRVHVAGYQPAHPRHGGGGAFYIRLRKHKD